jgi:hypothetical protein
VFALAIGWAVRYHFFGVGYFRPVLVTEKQILDLGDVLQDSLTETEFSVENGGWRSLKIKDVRTGCAGCVEILSYPKEPIRRNATAPIRVALNTKSLKGKVRKSIIILSNDPVHSVYPMLIDAVVEREKEANKEG